MPTSLTVAPGPHGPMVDSEACARLGEHCCKVRMLSTKPVGLLSDGRHFASCQVVSAMKSQTIPGSTEGSDPQGDGVRPSQYPTNRASVRRG